MSYFSRALLTFLINFLITNALFAQDGVVSVFPLKNYKQNISTWINPSDDSYDKPLLSLDIQEKRYDIFYDHYFGELSPWDTTLVTKLLQRRAPDSLKSTELELLNTYSNKGKYGNDIGYGENFRPHSIKWITDIRANIDLAQFDHLVYEKNNRGISTANLAVRSLPTKDPHYYSYKIAGQGYPFDNLQMSSLWVGTPVYILAQTSDKAWDLILTPDFIGWVESHGIAHVDDAFVKKWTAAARNKLAAIIKNHSTLTDDQGNYLLSAYIGTILPLDNQEKVMIPAANKLQAEITTIPFDKSNMSIMPLPVTPHRLAQIISSLIGRPYGWGGLNFNNDCSAELKNMFTPFGIWLPRHSSDQVTAGKLVDMTNASAEKRIDYLKNNGQPLTTLVYIGHHIMLYTGNTMQGVPMTYQDMWGLSPTPPIRRAVIGKSLFFPLLLQYPEDTSLNSQANRKYFKIVYLNHVPSNLIKYKYLDLKSLMFPETLF